MHRYTSFLHPFICFIIKIETDSKGSALLKPCKVLLTALAELIYKLLKKYGIFALNFCTYSFIIFTWVLHVLKYCSFPYILQKNNKIGKVRAE